MSTQLLERPEVRLQDPAFEPDRKSEPLFTPAEIRQFDADDAEAGRRIGKILTSLFIYTVVAMSIVIWWTFRVVGP